MAHSIPHRRKVLLAALGAAALLLIGAAAAAVVLLSGAYSTAATKQHFAITYRILELGLRYSVDAAAGNLAAPLRAEARDLRTGYACYRQYCVQCHGAPGLARDPLGRGQLPSPSSLSQSAREWPIEHLFYVTQQGVRMSGMPAWEYRISEDGLWSTAAFLKHMAFLTAAEYRQFGASSDEESCPPADMVQPYTIERAQTTLRQYACDNCHTMDNLVGPQTQVGPTLRDFHRRKFIAGVLPNTPENLARWIMDPQDISPHSLMPDLQVSENHARDMARYLHSQ
jgi:mono/diheme cytochrome c family protein/cytochrome c551/c552